MSEASLYERLGGEAKIKVFVADILKNHQNNPAVSPRYSQAKKSDEELIRLVTALICQGTGGPQKYDGMSMLAAHTGMNVAEAEFVAVLDDILAALKKHGVGEREQAELLAIAYGMKAEIVHQ
ncbi:group I truncated hemoglobin [Limnobacter sp.]|uniref:group I truncated hemoglobin n=1 Tax=Limnobacter sp. TaxID=2003368 RepID=UPI002FE19ED0